MKLYTPFLLLIIACNASSDKIADNSALITTNASPATHALYVNMQALAKTNILFGHQDASMYGHNWSGDSDRSDVKDVCGSHPAVYGFDLAGLTHEKDQNERLTEETKLRSNIVAVQAQGAIVTLSWHLFNPVNEESFYFAENPIAAVSGIIPSGEHHAKYKHKLDLVAQFAKSLKTEKGDLIPVIFRPFHEYDGDWFWWGVPHHCTKSEFLDLWKFTVHYLKDSCQVQNFIYAFSPDCRFKTKDDFLEYYPGDTYVDLIGMDNYWDFRPDGGSLAEFASKIQIVSDIAKEHHKLCALTETGLESIPNAEWWTKVLLHQIKDKNLQLSFVLVWRNAYQNPTHFYAPYPGQASVDDFVQFYNDPYTVFLNDLKDMYHVSN